MLRVTMRVLCRYSLRLPDPYRCSTFLPKRHNDGGNKNTQMNHLKKYWIYRYIDYIKNYDKVLEKKFPKSMHVYRVFSHGTSEFYQDLKRYVQVRKKIRLSGVDSLTREELQLSFTLPRDLLKITPVLLVSAVPFTNYIIFPLAFYFPHVLLTSHYWSIQDKLNFMLKEHKKRLKHNKPLFRCLQKQVSVVNNPQLQTKFKDIIAHLGSGTHPKVHHILACKDLFSGVPYSLKALKRKHVLELLKIHGMSRFGFRHRNRLLERGLLIKLMDDAILREGGVSKLPYDAIRWALSFRGINPVNMSIDSMEAWLNQWLLMSTNVDSNSISLLLHGPILLAYNYETNWTLLYHSKKKHK